MKHSLSHQRIIALDTSNNRGLDELRLRIRRAAIHDLPLRAIEQSLDPSKMRWRDNARIRMGRFRAIRIEVFQSTNREA
jgi:hypothetical protein